MAQKVMMKQKDTGLIKPGFIGFSWTTLFFGMWPALFRSDFITFIGAFVIFVILGLITFGFGALVAQIVWAFMYNKYYTRKLIDAGYRFADSPVLNELAAASIGMSKETAAAGSVPATAE